jgi:hypothetical protein
VKSEERQEKSEKWRRADILPPAGSETGKVANVWQIGVIFAKFGKMFPVRGGWFCHEKSGSPSPKGEGRSRFPSLDPRTRGKERAEDLSDAECQCSANSGRFCQTLARVVRPFALRRFRFA